MVGMLRTLGRVLWMHWPALLAWFLAGLIVRELVIPVAGWVGIYSSLGMYAILPIATLARLVSFVAMFLVVRDSLRELQAIAPLPASKVERRQSFIDGVLGGILPFFAVYYAWGYVRDDVFAATRIAIDGITSIRFLSAFAPIGETTEVVVEQEAGEIPLSPFVIVIIIAAFAARWALKKYKDKLPKWTAVIAVYFEALWLYLLIFVIRDLIALVTGWFESRVGMLWLQSIGDWFAEHLSFVAWLWEGAGWLAGEVLGVIALPLAWLAIAGTVYGQAISSEQPTLRSRRLKPVQARYSRLPKWLRSRLKDVSDGFTDRFRPVWNAIVLMWRAGPLLIAAYVLLYSVWVLLERWTTIALPHVFGPHEAAFWGAFLDPIAILVAVLFEPLRIAIVSSAYNGALGQSRRSVRKLEGDGLVARGDGDKQVVGDGVGNEVRDA